MFTPTSDRADGAHSPPDDASAQPGAALVPLHERLQRPPDFPALQLCPDARQLDERDPLALHQNLGRMVTAAHLPDEALAVRASPQRSETLRWRGWRANDLADTTLADFLSRHTRALGDALLRSDARHEVPRQALQVLWQGLQARRAVLHLGPDSGDGFRPVRVLGLPLRRLGQAVWQVSPLHGHDLFSRLCADGADSLIDDARRPQIARHLPPAFVQGLNARHFLVLPIQARARQLGMIYLDRADGEPFTLDAQAMQLVREVRNQAALALL